MANLTQEQWRQQLHNDENAVIIDVRTETELEEGFIPNAINLDIFDSGHFMEEVNALDKSKNYYVYCRSGSRSSQACAIMNSVGIANTYNLIGGFTEWDGEIIG